MRRLSIVLAFLVSIALAGQALPKNLLSDSVSKGSSEQVKIDQSGGIRIAIAPGKDEYPGIRFEPQSGPWNLSQFGHVEARLVNTGANPVTVFLRVDNAGNYQDNPWNTESLTLGPGKSGNLRTVFGYQYGFKKGFALNPAQVVGVSLFTGKSQVPLSFSIASITAGGSPGEGPPSGPDDLRIKPKGGLMFGGPSASTASLDYRGGAGPFASLSTPSALQMSFPADYREAIVRLRPPQGRWDLREFTEVRVRFRNVGSASATPRARVESNGGTSDWANTVRPIPPQSTGEVTVPFAHLITLGQGNQADIVTSDSVSSVDFSADASTREVQLVVERVEALAPTAQRPSWLGKRPPVSGEWAVTLDQRFDRTLDSKVWKVTGENYYDKQSHWAKDEVILKDGMLHLRYEKKSGFQNDDPKRAETPYAAAYLDTFGLWAQRYGYFEARMKLPRAPGLWPAFWMMPDRGSLGGLEQWKRQDTANGGMEFDIMEQLTRWGPHRYNIAMHWDGYQKDHKSLGCEKNYVETDQDGFVTCGLLWTPGHVAYYCNGKEILRWDNPRISSVPSILMFTIPSGGWDNDAIDDKKLPADWIVDYVRVWQRKDLASALDGRRHDPLK